MNHAKVEQSQRKQTRNKIADFVVLSKIPWYLDIARRPVPVLKDKEKEFDGCMKFLTSRGCDRRALIVVLNLGTALRTRESKASVPKAKTVKALIRRMKRLAEDITAAESSHFMIILNQQETGKWCAGTGLGPEDVDDLSLTFPFLAIPKWLKKRAEMYEEWLQLSSQKVPPKGPGLARIARLCLGLYVKYATGKTHFPEVVELLEYAGFGGCSVGQLSREMKEFTTGFPWSYSHLQLQFRLLHRPNTNSRRVIVGGIPVAVRESRSRTNSSRTARL